MSFRTNRRTGNVFKVYHGTTNKYLESIKKEGLRPSKYRFNVTNDPEDAVYYARISSRVGGNPVILEYEIPAERYDEFVEVVHDPRGQYAAYSLKKNLPTEFLVGVREI